MGTPVYTGDYVVENSSGLPGRVAEVQSGHLQVSFAGQAGTRQVAYDAVRLITEPDADTKAAIDSNLLDTNPGGNTVSPVSANRPTIGEVFPDLAGGPGLEPGEPTALSTAHPWPGLVGSGLHDVRDADGNPHPVYRDPLREREQAIIDAAEARRMADEDELLANSPNLGEQVEARRRAAAEAAGFPAPEQPDPTEAARQRNAEARERAATDFDGLALPGDSKPETPTGEAGTGGDRYDGMDLPALQAEARDRGLSDQGNTRTLKARLREADRG